LKLNDTTALIVEDDAHSLVTLSSLLKDLGIRYKRNTTGSRVLAQLRAMHPSPAFVLLDLTLPDADSLAICRAIRADSQWYHLPIVALCDGYPQNGSFTELRSAGFTGCIRKPFPQKAFGDLLLVILNGGTLWEIVS